MKPSLGSCGGCCAAPPGGGSHMPTFPAPLLSGRKGGVSRGLITPGRCLGPREGPGSSRALGDPGLQQVPGARSPTKMGARAPKGMAGGPPNPSKLGRSPSRTIGEGLGCAVSLGHGAGTTGGGFDKTMTRIREHKLVGVPGALEGPRKGAAPGLRPHRLPCRPVCVRECVRPSV